MERVCGRCSTLSNVEGEYCPHCGSSFDRRSRWSKWSRRRRILTIVVPVTAAALIGGGLYGWKAYNDAEAEERREAAARQAEVEAQEAEAKARAARKEERAIRRLTVAEMEKSITNYAQKQSEKEFAIVDGPILFTQCEEAAGSDVNDLTVDSMEFSCLAASKELAGGRISGSAFTAQVDFESGEYTWHLGR